MRSEISLSFIVLIVIISEFNAICDDEKLENYNVTSNKANISDGVCNSLVCENAAKLIINGRNESVKPCDDFYSYVCGNWSNNYQIPENSKFIDVRTMAEMKLKTLVKEIIQQPVDFNDSKHLSLEKKWFNTCVDTDTILNSGQSLLMNISERIGGMPFTMNSSEWEIKNISWQEVDIYYTNLIGQSVFFNFEVVHYNGTPKLFLAKPKTKNISEKSHQILNFFANRTQLNISETDVHDIIILQQHLNEIIEHPDSILKNEVTLKNSQENYNTICPKFTNGEMDFLKIISALFNSTNLEVNENEFMYFNSRYFIKLCQLFRATTSKNIANYIHWSFLVDSFDYWYISDEMLIKENRVNQCFELMPFFKGYCSKIVDIYILNTTEDLIENIIPNTKTQLLKKISNSSWMSDSLFLKNKLENIEFQFAPIFEKDTQSPEGAHFYNYNIEVTNYFLQNWINLKNVKKLKIVKMMKTVSQDRTRRTAYRKSKNLVEVTLDLLTSDLFNAELPIAMNFGSLGFIVSHAMVRAFGKTVRKYDGRKHPKQWTKEMIGIQEKKLQCFKNQFQNYTGEADLLFDHDFARTVGLNIDFETFQNVRNGTIDDLKLPGLENLHMDKLFFITFAMNLCENIEPEFAIKAYSKGLLPKSVILNAAVSNSEEFARTFQCKRGDILWKDDKCNYF